MKKATQSDTAPRNRWGALALLAAGLMVTVLGSRLVKEGVETAAQREFEFSCNEIRLNIEARLAICAQILRSGAALFDGSEEVSRDEWRAFVQRLRLERQTPGIQGFGYALLIPRAQLDPHIQAIRREGFPEYQVRPAGERETYSAIIYLEPFSDRNLRAFGYDMLSEPVRRAAMEQARDERTEVLSGKVSLVQETGQDVQSGTLMYMPVYRHGLPTETVEQRRAAIQGWVFSPYRMTDLMRGTLRGWEAKQKGGQLFLQVYDGDEVSAAALLYDSRGPGTEASASTARDTRLIPVAFAGHRWTLRFTKFGGAAAVDYGMVWLSLAGGAIISLLVFGLMHALGDSRAAARQLRKDITARKQAEQELQASETRYRRLFQSAKDGILILEADTGRIVDVNPFLIVLLGYSHADFVGKQLWEIGLFKDIAASKEAFLALQAKGYVRYENLPLETRDGRRIDVEFVSNSYLEDSARVIQCNIRDITERRRMEKRREVTTQVLALLNRSNDINQLVGDILRLLKAHTGMEAVGIRLREGDDFPYYETNGLSADFVAAERHLCARGASGDLIRDASGTPALKCMCGTVLSGRFDPAKPFFTAKGSFWTNSTTEWGAGNTEFGDWNTEQGTEGDQSAGFASCLRSPFRAPRLLRGCIAAGYESLALIPVRMGNDVIGLIQLNDHRKGKFTEEDISFFEELGASIGIAVARRWAMAAVKKGLAEAEQSRRVLLSMMEDQKRTAEEREQMRAQLVQAQKLESIGTLAGGVAHEINNPIMGIMGYTQMILDQAGTEGPVSEYAAEIGKEAERVATIVKNLLGFARLDNELHQSPARLCDIVENTLSLIHAVMRHDQITLEVDVPADLPRILCRSQQLQQVVMNLVTNARDALNERYAGFDQNKKVIITARVAVISDQLSVNSERSKQSAVDTDHCSLITDHCPPSRWLRLTLEDHGAGITEDVRARIFEPFFTTKPRGKGTGLGLSISHGIIKEHGGELSVESEVGQWTRFHVDLPIADAGGEEGLWETP